MLFTGAKPVAPATKMIGFVGILAQEERAERCLRSGRVSPTFIASNTCVVKRPPGIKPDLQLDHVVRVRRRREREAPLLAVRQDDVDVLAGVEAERLAVDLELHDHHVGGGLCHRDRPWPRIRAGGCRRAAASGTYSSSTSDSGVALHASTIPFARSSVDSAGFLMRSLLDRPVEDGAFALAAAAVAAFVRERDALAQRGFEDRLAGSRRDDPVVRSHHEMQIVLRGAAWVAATAAATKTSVSAPTAPHTAPGDHA